METELITPMGLGIFLGVVAIVSIIVFVIRGIISKAL